MKIATHLTGFYCRFFTFFALKLLFLHKHFTVKINIVTELISQYK